jgi:SNF2 family DNA or RNA helicase
MPVPGDLLFGLFSGLVKSPGTLVVCPASLMMQWAEEVKTKLNHGTLSTKVYHGSNRTSFAQE